MTEAIIVGLISGVVTLVTSLTASILVFISNNKKLKADQEKMIQEQIKAQDKKIEELKTDLQDTLSTHKDVYLSEINSVHQTIAEIKAENQQYQAVFSLKIDSLEKAQNKHNSVIERTFICEREIEVLKNREKVSEHRLDDLEKMNNDGK